MSNVKTQTRGNCPCCGREQAVLASGRMSKHGYTVEDGWFNGVCSGDRYEPMQIQREVTDQIVVSVRKDVATLMALAEDFAAGRKVISGLVNDPTHYPRRKEDHRQVEFATLAPYQQHEMTRSHIWNLEQRARAGASFADGLERIVNQVHGQPLREVELEAGPAPIQNGEKRKSPSGSVLTVRYTERGRVYWVDERGFRSWTGSSAFRKYELV